MPKITEERRDQQRRRIIDAMLLAIQRKGIVTTSMSDVIELSGLSAGAIYGYFDGKDEIFRAAVEPIIRGRSAALAGLADESPVPPPDDALRRLIEDTTSDPLDTATLLQIWGHVVTQDGLRHFVAHAQGELRARVETYLRAWFVQEGTERPDAEARAAAPVVIALAQGHIVQTALTGHIDVGDFLTGCRALLATYKYRRS